MERHRRFEVDRFNPRKGTTCLVHGARRSVSRACPAWIALVQAPFAILFTLLLGPKALAWFAALIVAAALYNCRPFVFKGRPGLDLLNQAGYLLVFVLASWLNHISQVPWFTFVFGAMVRDALPPVRGNHGLGARSTRRPPIPGRRAGSTAGEVAVWSRRSPSKRADLEVGPRSVARRVSRRQRGLVHAWT